MDVDPECETLEFGFDLSALELAGYETYDHSSGIVYGTNGFFCKTQFAGLKAHVLVCKVIKLTEKYIDSLSIYDEGDYYHTGDLEKTRQVFGESVAMIESFDAILKDMSIKLGFEVVIGNKF